MLPGLSSLLQMGGPSRWNPPTGGGANPIFSWMPRGTPAQMPGAFHPQPVGGMWGGQPPMQGPVQYPAAFHPQPSGPMPAPSRFPTNSGLMPNSQFNVGAQSQMRPARPGY